MIINYVTGHSDFHTRRSSCPRFALISTRVFTRRFVSAMRLDRAADSRARLIADSAVRKQVRERGEINGPHRCIVTAIPVESPR